MDDFTARYYAATLSRFMTPDQLGGHQEDPQTFNKYSYVRNNPVTLTDPTGLDFNLSCDKNNGTTCQGGNQYYEDQNGKYQETVVKSDDKGNLTDQRGNKYTGTFDGKTVSFTNADGTKSSGSWIQGSNQTSGIKGGGGLSDKFSFTFFNHGKGQTLNAGFNYAGSVYSAEQELQKAGFSLSGLDEIFNLREMYENPNSINFRTPGDQGTGRNSSHALVDMGYFSLTPNDSVPTTGQIHVGETNWTQSIDATKQHLLHEQ